MPKLTVKLTKTSQDPWILSIYSPPSLEYFTQEEIDTVIVPYFTEVRNMTGLTNITETTDGNIKFVEYTFDNMENMSKSKSVMADSQLAKKRAEILRLAMLNNNITPYIVETTIIKE